MTLSRAQLQRTLLALVAPIVGIATIALFTTFTAHSIRFTDESNALTSGGFGPNQVSSLLGLGALVTFYILTDPSLSTTFKWVTFGLLTVFATQSALTFSRGGLYLAAAAALTGGFFLLRDRNARFRLLLSVIVVVIVAGLVVIPWLDDFTQGAFTTRFSNTDPSGRDTILLQDLKIFLANPILGVGPGMGTKHRTEFKAVAHSEFSRLLAEHGLLGLVALLLLVVMALRRFWSTTSPRERAFVAALTTWSFLFMLANAMRTVTPGFVLALSTACFVSPRYVRSVLPPARGSLPRPSRSRR